jgi:hypothetical protein
MGAGGAVMRRSGGRHFTRLYVVIFLKLQCALQRKLGLSDARLRYRKARF